jgi:ClpP class serine protease
VDVVPARPGRSLTKPDLEELADGRIFTAEQAAAARLIDLINVNADGLELLSGTEFMYLWKP